MKRKFLVRMMIFFSQTVFLKIFFFVFVYLILVIMYKSCTRLGNLDDTILLFSEKYYVSILNSCFTTMLINLKNYSNLFFKEGSKSKLYREKPLCLLFGRLKKMYGALAERKWSLRLFLNTLIFSIVHNQQTLPPQKNFKF